MSHGSLRTAAALYAVLLLKAVINTGVHQVICLPEWIYERRGLSSFKIFIEPFAGLHPPFIGESLGKKADYSRCNNWGLVRESWPRQASSIFNSPDGRGLIIPVCDCRSTRQHCDVVKFATTTCADLKCVQWLFFVCCREGERDLRIFPTECRDSDCTVLSGNFPLY